MRETRQMSLAWWHVFSVHFWTPVYDGKEVLFVKQPLTFFRQYSDCITVHNLIKVCILISITDHFNLTHWGRMMHLCIKELTIISSDNCLLPRPANAGILLIKPLRANSIEILIEIHIFSFNKMHLKILHGKFRPFCLGLNVLIRSL